MTKLLFLKANKVGLALAAAFLVTLTGCVGYVDGPRTGVEVESPAFAVQDDYVYYPQYECYYSVSRHQYAYREGNAWVARPAPRGVSVNVLMRSPSVKMNFHDSPANHHADRGQAVSEKLEAVRLRNKVKIARTTRARRETITEDKQAKHIHTLKGILC